MTQVAKRQRRLTGVRVTEVSAVDHPAHLQEGWVLQKSVDRSRADAVTAALKGGTMPKTIGLTVATSLLKSLSAEQRRVLGDEGAEALAKALSTEDAERIKKDASASDLQPVLDQLAQIWQSLRDIAEKEDPDVPSTAVDPNSPAAVPAAAPAAPDAAAVLAAPALAKALEKNPELAPILKALEAQNAATAEELRKERESRADEAAIVAFEKAYNGIEIDARVVAPALRKFAAADPEAAKAIQEAISKAHAANEGASRLITKELGRVQTPSEGTPEAQIETLAKAKVAAGTSPTIEQARLAAMLENPSLYDAHRAAADAR